jgi:hypothetical protein
MNRMLPALLGLVAAAGAAQAAEERIDLPSRRTTVRMVMEVPPNPVGSVVLLAGGAGILAIDDAGRIRTLSGNQLVRSRSAYVAAGFAVAVPDIAEDLKGANAYRADSRHGQDIAAVIAFMRQIKGPVALVATSRAAISAATTMLKQNNALPDALVITSGMLRGDFSAEAMGDPARIKVPVLLLIHQDDTCRVTLPSDVPAYARKLTGSPKVETITMTGGATPRGDPCEAFGPHGFAGLDQQVVDTVTAWLKANMR